MPDRQFDFSYEATFGVITYDMPIVNMRAPVITFKINGGTIHSPRNIFGGYKNPTQKITRLEMPSRALPS